MEIIIDSKGIQEQSAREVEEYLPRLEKVKRKIQKKLKQDPDNSQLKYELETIEKAISGSKQYIKEKKQKVALFINKEISLN